MFAQRYFGMRPFAPRYFPKRGGATTEVPHTWWTAPSAPAGFTGRTQRSGYTAGEAASGFTAKKTTSAFTAVTTAGWTGGDE